MCVEARSQFGVFSDVSLGFFFFEIYFMYISVLPECMYVYHVHAVEVRRTNWMLWVVVSTLWILGI